MFVGLRKINLVYIIKVHIYTCKTYIVLIIIGGIIYFLINNGTCTQTNITGQTYNVGMTLTVKKHKHHRTDLQCRHDSHCQQYWCGDAFHSVLTISIIEMIKYSSRN